MKIGIVGAPGSGKYHFASDLAAIMDEDFFILHATHPDGIGYVDDLRSGTGLEYGGFGNHIDDIQVVFKRREWELAWTHRERDTITVSTVLDSAAHCFIRTEETAHNRYETGLQAERLRTIAGTFGLLYTDTWDYDYAFFLPYKGEDRHSRLINAALVDMITTYRTPIFSFEPEVPDDEKASTAAKAIAALESDNASPIEERRVRRGFETGEAVRDTSEPVPDVSE
jgi:hypothetical protein